MDGDATPCMLYRQSGKSLVEFVKSFEQRYGEILSFGDMIRLLRDSRNITRPALLFMFHACAERLREDDYDIRSEAWLARVEENKLRRIDPQEVECICLALDCTQEERSLVLKYLFRNLGLSGFVEDLRKMETKTKASGLTNRQLEILRLAGQGLNSREIATKLQIEKGTVDTHWNRIRELMDIGDRKEILYLIKSHGVI